tara:strand:- start:231 stop:632 length:402 start_codon:yes stop_codon:yes gene_type:complete
MTKPHISLEIVKAAARKADAEGKLGYQNEVIGCAYSSAALEDEPESATDHPCAVAVALPDNVIAEIVIQENNTTQWMHLLQHEYMGNLVSWDAAQTDSIQRIQDAHDAIINASEEDREANIAKFRSLIGATPT